MSVALNPYLSFKDDARQAMQFYQTVFGGKLDLSTFGEFQEPGADTTLNDTESAKIMHAQLTGDNDITFMGADTPDGMTFEPASRISMSLSGDDESLLRGWWDKLGDGGTVTMPMEKAPWGDSFGMLTDKYGVKWLVNISGPKAADDTQA